MNEARPLTLEESTALLNDLDLYRQLFEEAVQENDALVKRNLQLEQATKALEKELARAEDELATRQWEADAKGKKNHSRRLWQSLTASNESLTEVTRCLNELSKLIYGFDEPKAHHLPIVTEALSLIEHNEKLLLITKQ